MKDNECETCGGCGEVPYLGSPVHGMCEDCNGTGKTQPGEVQKR